VAGVQSFTVTPPQNGVATIAAFRSQVFTPPTAQISLIGIEEP
jgi:hypothetical protein